MGSQQNFLTWEPDSYKIARPLAALFEHYTNIISDAYAMLNPPAPALF